MTTRRKPMARWLRGLVVAGVVLLPLRAQVYASPGNAEHPVTASSVDLHLAPNAAARIAMQEGDTEKPHSMKTAEDEPAPSTVVAPKKTAAAGDTFGFVKEWPFWAIVGGVLVATVGVVVIYKNSHSDA